MAKELKEGHVFAKTWREIDNEGIIVSIDIGLSVLKDRQLTEREKKQLLAVMDDTLGILINRTGEKTHDEDGG
jgi:hypothetical protein